MNNQPETGRVVVVDATTGSVTDYPLQETVRLGYLGGSCLASRLWLESTRLEVDPLSAANTLVIAPGLLTGFPVPHAGRTSLAAKSPLTGLLSDSSAGGSFGARLKALGVAALVIKGAFDEPSYIVIDGEECGVRLEKAGILWGQDVFFTYEALKERHGERAEAAIIGPAGENGVYFASVVFCGARPGSASRTGMGAVMGSKNLKAVLVRGDRSLVPRDPRGLEEAVAEFLARTRETASKGNPGSRSSMPLHALRLLPARNWREGTDPGVYGPPGAEVLGQGVTLEAFGAFGPLCLVKEPRYISLGSETCLKMGLDLISAGSAAAFAMEAYERGIIGDEDAGRALTWGDGEAVLFILDEIVNQQGLGSLLSRGTRAAAAKLGPLAGEFAVHVKGLEVPVYDPRVIPGLAVFYATGSRGACHLDGLSRYILAGEHPDGRAGVGEFLEAQDAGEIAGMAIRMQDLSMALDSLGLYKSILHAAVSTREIARWVECCLGTRFAAEDLHRAGERSFTLRRLCNVALGITRKDDFLPPRLLSHPRHPAEGGSLPYLGEMLHEYYASRGWDQEGLPTVRTLEKLELTGYPKWLGIRTKVLTG